MLNHSKTNLQKNCGHNDLWWTKRFGMDKQNMLPRKSNNHEEQLSQGTKRRRNEAQDHTQCYSWNNQHINTKRGTLLDWSVETNAEREWGLNYFPRLMQVMMLCFEHRIAHTFHQVCYTKMILFVCLCGCFMAQLTQRGSAYLTILLLGRPSPLSS